MIPGKIRDLVLHTWGCLLSRPWIGSVVFLALKAVSLISFGVLFANMCESRFRFMAELPDRLIVILYGVAMVTWLASFVFGVVLLLLPIVPLCRRMFGVAYRMLVYNLGAVFVGALLFVPEFMLMLMTGDSYAVARANLMCTDCSKRKPQVRLHQGIWEFCNRRYALYPEARIPMSYHLCDLRARYLPDEHRWEDRVLLSDIVQWEESNRRLYLLTLEGEKHILNFDSGVVHKYPDKGAYRQCKETDEIFARLGDRAHYLEKYK